MNANTNNSRMLMRAAVFTGLMGAAAWAQPGPGWNASPRGVQRIADIQKAPFRLAGSATPAAPRTDNDPAQALERMYDNTSLGSLFINEAQPHRACDQGSFLPGGCLAGPVRVMSVEFGMYVNPGPNGEASFDAQCLFYSRRNAKATPSNSKFLGGFTIEARNLPSNQAYTTGPIDLRSAMPEGILIPGDSFFVDIVFYEPGSTKTLSSRATPLFSGGGVTLGQSDDAYWLDANADGRYEANEAATFGGDPWQANFYLVLDGVVSAACPADFNADGALNTRDFFDFLGAFFDESSMADFNQDAVVNSQDFFDYLTAFLTGCP